MGIEFNSEQLNAVYMADSWWKHSTNQLFEISGPAGSGKTTLLKYLIEQFGLLPSDVLFVAYTGKASTMMARNGLPAQTAHSAFYTYEHVKKKKKKGKLVLKPNGKVDTEGKFIKKDTLDKDYSLIVIDEASMIPEAMAKDIFSFHIPIIAVGDLNQLPPVFGNSVFLQEPDVVLTKVMRQAEGDPIIYLAHRVLHGEPLKVGVYKNSYVIRKEDLSDFQMQSADEILTGTNRLRLAINDKFRDEYLRFKYRDFPQPGEKVVCKKNNWERKIGSGIYLTNGMTGFVEYVDKSSYRKNSFTMDFKPDFGNRGFRNLKVNYKRLMKPNEYDPEQEEYGDRFLDAFEFGYAITVHSSQGSQWESVLFMDQKAFDYDTQKRLEYTAITRARTQIGIVLQ